MRMDEKKNDSQMELEPEMGYLGNVNAARHLLEECLFEKIYKKLELLLNPYMVILQRIDNVVKCVIMYTKQKLLYENNY